jgi:acyl-CoA thioesterase YciA
MPADATDGDIFGGWVLSQMDIAAGMCGATSAGPRCDGRHRRDEIHPPVSVGDVLCVYCRSREGRSHVLAIHLEAWALKNRIGERVKVTEGLFTFVAIDADGKPRPVPADVADRRDVDQ